MAADPRRAASGQKYKMTCGLPVAALLNCADNSGAKNLFTVAVKERGARLNRLPSAGEPIV
jgi:large subunit ribosomal protein L23e